tara:strand:- start:386 stop:9019 length:8634 start_codon:yes stop_codon:yes gene_type:complete
MNEYLVELYSWIKSTDPSFEKRYTFDDFQNNMSDDQYSGEMYEWISSTDPTFSEREPIDIWSAKVKKKSGPQNVADELSIGVPAVTESPLTPGSSDGLDPNSNIPPLQEEEVVDGIDATDYTINDQVVEEEVFEDYSEKQDTLKKETEDPFAYSIDVVNKSLINGTEESAVPLMNYHFGQYGFEFEESDALGDGMKIKAANGAEKYVNLDPFFGIGAKQEKDALEKFLKDNKAESRRLKLLEEDYTELERKIRGKEDINTSIGILNIDANLFNNEVQQWLRDKSDLDSQAGTFERLSQEQLNDPTTRKAFDEYLAKRNEVNKRRQQIIARDARLKTEGYALDQTAGRYSQMKSEQGQMSGSTIDSFWNGVGRINSSIAGFMYDAAGYGLEYGGAGEENFKKLYMSQAQKMFGIKSPGKDYDGDWKSYLENVNPEQRKDVESKVRDILIKQAKFDIYDWEKDGGAVLKNTDGGGAYSSSALSANAENKGFIDALRKGAEEGLGSSSTSVEYTNLKKQGFWGGAYLGLVESVPAMLGGNNAIGWAQRTGNMFAQVTDHLNEEMFNDPDFADITEAEKLSVAIPIGITVAALESIGLRNVMRQKGILNSVLLKSLGKYKGASRLKGRPFAEVVRNEVDNMVARGTLVVTNAGLAEFETGAAQEVADIGGKWLYNNIKEKQMFTTPETVLDGIKQIAYSGAQEMVGGFIMGTPQAMISAASEKDFTQLDTGVFEVFEDMIGDGTSTKLVNLFYKNKINKGEMTAKEAKESEAIFNEIKGVYSKVPSNYSPEQKKIALGLLLSKQRLETEIAGKDPSSVVKQKSQIESIQNEIEALSNNVYVAAQNKNLGNVETEEESEVKVITEEEAVTSLKEQGVENPTSEQIKTEKDALQVKSTEEMVSEESTESSSEVEQNVLKPGTPGKSNPESKNQNLKTQEKIDQTEAEDFANMVDPESETTVETDKGPKSLKKFKNENDVEIDIEVNEETPNLFFSKKNTVKQENSLADKIINQAKFAAKAISKIFPNVKIVIHDDIKEYKKIDSVKNAKALFQPKDNTIHINLSNANARTVGHEIFHAVLLGKLKNNNKIAQAVTKKMIQALVRSKTLDKATRQELNNFVKNYDSEIKNEEKLAEIVGMIASNYMSLDSVSKSKVRQWVEKIADKLNIEIGQSDQDVIDLLNTIARKTATGTEITEGDLASLSKFEGGTNVKNPSDAFSRRQVGEFSVSYTENDNISTYVKDGRVTQPKNLEAFRGNNTAITSPDDMVVGEVKFDGEVIFEGQGGLFFVTSTGDVWAAGNMVTANKLASMINRSVNQNGGKGYLTLTKGTDKKLISSSAGVISSLGIIDVLLNKKLIPASTLRTAVKKVVKEQGGGNINLTGSSRQMVSQLKDFFGNKNNATFEKRGLVMESLIKEIGMNLPAELKGKNSKLTKILLGDPSKTLVGGKTSKTANSLVDLVALIAAESITKGLNTGDVYAVIEVDGKVETYKGSHPSYPAHIRQVNKKSPILHLPKNRPPAADYLMRDSGKIYKTPAVSPTEYGSFYEDVGEGTAESFSGEIEAAGVRRQRGEAENLGKLYNMNKKGFMPKTIFVGPLITAARKLGITIEKAIGKEGYNRGELLGYYFSNGVTKNGKPKFYNPRVAGVRRQQSMSEIGKSQKSIIDIINLGRENNIKDNTIVDYLSRVGKFKMQEIKSFLKISNFPLKNIPKSFGNIEGGMLAGAKLFEKVYNFRKNLMDNNLTPTGKKIMSFNNKIDALKAELDKPVLFNNKKRIKEINKKIKTLEDALSSFETKAREQKKIYYKFSQSEIDAKTVEFLEGTEGYRNESDKGFFTTQQAQMISQMTNAFGATPMRDTAGRIKRAKEILNQRTKGKTELKKLQINLRNFIRQSLPSEIYESKDVKKLINAIITANSGNIENIKEEVLEFVNTKTNESLTNKINKILEGKYDDLQSGRKKGYKVDDSTRIRLERIKERLKNINSKTPGDVLTTEGQKIENEISEIESEAIQDLEQRSEIADLNIVLDYINAQLNPDSDVSKTSDLQEVVLNLNGLIENGKTILEADLRQKHMQYVQEFQEGMYEITGQKINLYIENTDFNDLQLESNKNPRLILNPEAENQLRDYSLLTKNKKQKTKNKAVRVIKNARDGMVSFINGNLDLSSLMSLISKMPGEIFGGKLQENVTFKIDEGTRDYKARKMATTLIINAKLEEVYGKNWRSISAKDSSLTPTGIFTDNGIELPELSQNQMAYLVNQYKDPANENSYKKKYGKDYKRIMKEMEAKLNDNVKELARWQVEEFFPSLYESYNEAYKKVYRTSMPWNQFYAGRIYREGIDSSDAPDILSNSKGSYRGFASPASTKIRIQNDKPIADIDQMSGLMTYVNDMNYFAAMGSPLNDVSKLFNNSNIRQAITNNYGNGAMSSIDDMINKLSNRGVNKEYGTQWINNITSAFVIGRLSINPTIFIKQLTSAPAYATDIGFRNWTKNSILGMPSIIKNWKEISSNSVYIQDRYGETILRTLETYAPSKVENLIPSDKMGSLIDALMYLVKQGDKGAIIIGGVPNYVYYKNEFKNKNPQSTEQEAIDYAIIKFERDTKRTQQSSDLQDKDQYQTGGVFERALNMFQTSIKQYLRKELTAARNLYRKIESGGKEGKGTYWENLKVLFVYHSLLPVVFQYTAAGLPGILAPWDDEDPIDLLRAATIGNLNAMFIVGELFSGLGDALTGKPWASSGQAASLPILETAAAFNKAIARADKTKDSVKKEELYKKAIFDLVNSMGLPLRQVERLVENSQALMKGGMRPEEMILRILQFSEYQIESNQDRKDKKSKPKKGRAMNNTDLKKYFPDAYERKKELEDKFKDTDSYRRMQELKLQAKQRREEYLDQMYN